MSPLMPNSSVNPNEINLLNSDLSKDIAKKRESIEQEKKNFLNLYIEMLKNQDPSSPMDYSQMANMTLSFQNTSNILDIKELLYAKSQETAEAKLANMAELVGREVILAGNELKLKADNKGSQQAEVMYELPKKVKNATLVIRDQQGNIISEIKGLGTNQDMNTYTWTGQIVQDGNEDSEQYAPDGKYIYEIKVEGFDGEEVKAVTYCKGLITGSIRNSDGSIVSQTNSKTFDISKVFGIASTNLLT